MEKKRFLTITHKSVKKARHFFKSIISVTENVKYKYEKDIFFSIGENCLSDDILSRFSLKSFSSPYGSGRSNIEYILAFEKEGFADFINRDYMKYEYIGNKKVPRNKKYVATENKYNSTCINGFEFTHHDTIGDESIRKTIMRRCNRLMNITGKNITMLYHHRYCEQTDMELLIHHLQLLSEIYEARGNSVNVYLFYQVIASDENQRRVERLQNGNVYIYRFYTLKEWGGDDQDVFWARCDNDLLRVMIDDIIFRKTKNNRRTDRRFEELFGR